jgi:hypothetical protein
MDNDASMVERRPEPPNVPDLLRVSPMDTTTATDVETSMLDPVVISDNFCRFTLLNKGILHSHSKITLALENPDANDRFFPPNVGVASLIQRATLKVGTKTLQEIDGYNYMTAYKSMFISNEHQKQREQVQSGRCISHEFLYNDVVVASDGNVDEANTKAVGYGLSNGKEYDNTDFSETLDLRVPQWANIKNSPVFQIALSDLFPMLKQTQLPLYMMKEQVSIELTFEPASNNTRAQSASGVATSLYTIDTTEVKFIADYIFYPQEMMDAYAQQNRVISINHSDYRHSKVTVAHDVANSTQIRNLGGANRIVTKVITGLQANNADDLSILNKYHAMCPEVSYTRASATGANGSTTYNIKYNDRFLYPVDVENSARHFHNTAQAEGIPPMVTREEYSAEGTGLTDEEFMGYAMNEGTKSGALTGRGIQGRFGWAGFRLNRNERVNSRGLEIYYKYLSLSTESAYTQRSWLELAKLTTIVDGYVQTQLA